MAKNNENRSNRDLVMKKEKREKKSICTCTESDDNDYWNLIQSPQCFENVSIVRYDIRDDRKYELHTKRTNLRVVHER